MQWTWLRAWFQIQVCQGKSNKFLAALAKARLNDYFKSKGVKIALVADGTWGPKTIEALKKFQQMEGLDADGKMGPKTAQAIINALGKATVTTPTPSSTNQTSSGTPADTKPTDNTSSGTPKQKLLKTF